ncbi:ABC transporter ATP-binding protein [Natronospora cellulosivora (SeqCode)]
MSEPILKVENLSLIYKTKKGNVNALNDINFEIEAGSSLGLVGESGCGKTTMASSIMQLLADNAEIKSGKIFFKGIDLLSLSEKELRKYRWNGFSMIFQAAMNAMAPVYTVGDQIIEAIQLHSPATTYTEAEKKVADLFDLVGLDPSRISHYPHEYSGGMKQRAVIAMALACDPDLIIADEPTTALDVIVQDRILKRINQVKEKLGMSMIYISHDIAVIAEVSKTMGVMYAGEMVEFGSTVSLFKKPIHPYTAGLMSSFPSIVGEKVELQVIPGEPPNLLQPPSGCKFHPRCKYASEKCKTETPPIYVSKEDNAHIAKCWHPLND